MGWALIGKYRHPSLEKLIGGREIQEQRPLPLHLQHCTISLKVWPRSLNSMFSYGTVAISLPLIAHRWNCLPLAKFDSCCAYRSGEIQFYEYLSVASVSLGLQIVCNTVVL